MASLLQAGVPDSKMTIPQQLSALFALLLHIAPIGLGWAQWQHFRVASAASPSAAILEVQLTAPAPVSNIVISDKTEIADAQVSDTAVPVSREDEEPITATAPQADNVLLPSPIYLASNELDVRPAPLEPVALTFPDQATQAGLVSAVLVLYIDQNGKVERIEVNDSTLPPAFEQAALSTFLQVRMRPGEKNGSRVRSRMKILIEFESQEGL